MKRIISFALCLVLSVFTLAGCANSSEPFEEKNYTPDIQVSEINLNVRDREIDVSLSKDGQVHIGYSENSKEHYNISVSDEGVLTMSGSNDKEWTDYIGGKPSIESRKILLQIPDKLLENLTLSTTNEDISIPALAVTGSIGISSNGGNITFENLDVENTLSVTAKNGNISGTVIGGYDNFSIHSETKKSKSNLPEQKNGGKKVLNVSCNNGDVSIEFKESATH